MERESFEDEETANALNTAFVCVKVDREERPDIDAIYMTVAQILTGRGGWPLTIIMTPEKEPFWAGTYLPKTSRGSMLGLMELITQVTQLWKTDRFKLVSDAASIVEVLSQTPLSTRPTSLNLNTLESTYDELASAYDEQNHGFGYAPKFPTPHNLLYLLRFWSRTKTPNAINMVKTTLDVMMNGGIHDQIGGGFHRYSTDNQWLIPHFEKMLYDQATLLLAYTEAHQATDDPKYAATARDIADYTLLRLRSPEGAFYSAEDADSEGMEGKFYTWTLGELAKVLDAEEAKIAERIYGVTESGNSPDRPGANILHIVSEDEVLASELGLSKDGLHEKIATIRGKLREATTRRVRPHLDDKALTDWNGLMIAALSKAGAILDEEIYVKAAESAATFILTKMNGSGLIHRFARGEDAIPAFLDDYAYFTWGLLELYEATFDAKYLQEAKRLADETIRLFLDPDVGDFYISRSHEGTLPRVKETHDGAKPSGNSVMAMNLLRLGKIIEVGLEAAADKLLEANAAQVEANPSSYTYLLCSLDYRIGPSYEVLIAEGKNTEQTHQILETLTRSYNPNKFLMLKTPSLDTLLIYTTIMHDVEGRTAIYICQNHACNLPLTDLKDALEKLET